ncbi:hypothetical protein SD70_02760 [Gordoniibacillus kamchatkensis]|uniref:DUF2334 domain-containing protein n=1 Tax=Gordoniibacillus kamchatkensis TaxID=1590651 RepID=A0ABR5AP35_9BACL|nr:DUF2334 domain-containing protein [Paenibacillus sp. VKM B-2647]KIL42117.1 hypothetical protein SD70_02760 [Paenibacillus sp. VKM B-2647]
MARRPKPRIYRCRLSHVLVAALLLFFLVPDEAMITAVGETTMPKFVMLRLEDVGPGGQYDSLEQLGKLRAVIEYMQARNIPVHLAVIPRWLNYGDGGSVYDRSLDDAGDPLTAAFGRVLRAAVQRGASVGMHGYTHQAGNAPRKDGFQESGIGNEFNVEGLPDTDAAAYADARLREGLRIMNAAGLPPRFWEAPHYHTTAEQDAEFRRYFGLLYQADVHANRNAPEAQYRSERLQGRGFGAVNVPTPFSYIPYNKDENLILDKLGKSKNIVSFFYHPFLEFKHLEQVTDNAGLPVLRDGIPEYRYPDKARTLLQKLAAKLKARGYLFYSIHDYVPFTPAAMASLGVPGGEQALLGDIDGDAAADLIRWERTSGAVTAASGALGRNRYDAAPEAKRWATIPYAPGSVMALCDARGDRFSDLWVLRGSGKVLERYANSGAALALKQTWQVSLGAARELFVLPQTKGGFVVAALAADQSALQGVYVKGDTAKPLTPFRFKTKHEKRFMISSDAGGLGRPEAPALVLSRRDSSTLVGFTPDLKELGWTMQTADLGVPAERGELALGDFNGDGREDAVCFDTERRTYTVYLQGPDRSFALLSSFGPWGGVGGKLAVADLDGNGKSDLALFEHDEPVADAALSYETRLSPVLAGK